MRTWRQTHPLTEDQRQKRHDSARKFQRNKRLTDPAWVDQERARGRAYSQKRRADPEFRKEQYRRHTEWGRKNNAYLNTKQRERNTTENYRIKAKTRLLQKKYGLSYEDYQRKLAATGGTCCICGGALGVKNAIDHNHVTGQVRDIICQSCNRWVGFIEKNRNLVTPMLEYLNRWEREENQQQLA